MYARGIFPIPPCPVLWRDARLTSQGDGFTASCHACTRAIASAGTAGPYDQALAPPITPAAPRLRACIADVPITGSGSAFEIFNECLACRRCGGTGSPGQPACSTVAIPDRFIIRAPADRRLPPPVANTYALLCWQPACMVPSPADRFERPSACTVPVKRHYVCLRRLSTAAAPRRGAPYSPRSCRSTRDLTNVDLVHTCAARGEPIVWFCRTQRKPSSQTANRRMPLREFSLGGSCAASQAEPPIFVPSGQRGITSGTCHELSPLNSPGRGNHRKQLAQHPS